MLVNTIATNASSKQWYQRRVLLNSSGTTRNGHGKSTLVRVLTRSLARKQINPFRLNRERVRPGQAPGSIAAPSPRRRTTHSRAVAVACPPNPALRQKKKTTPSLPPCLLPSSATPTPHHSHPTNRPPRPTTTTASPPRC